MTCDACCPSAVAVARHPGTYHPLPLLATKLFLPHPRPGLVARPHLLARLTTAIRGPLTLLVAPAGWGKTSLVSAWCATAHQDVDKSPDRPVDHDVRGDDSVSHDEKGASTCTWPVAWVSLDVGDNDPERFWAYALSALNTTQAGTGEDALALLCAPEPPPIETILTMLLNALATSPTDVVLVLDDYHLITANAVHTTLAFVLDHRPPRLHLVLATRQDPPLTLARLRAQGGVQEIRTADLRFTPAEAAAFLSTIVRRPQSAEAVRALEVRGEGWIAGLQLAAFSLRDHAPEHVDAFIAALSGGNRYIVDYLVEEVLAQQAPALQAFLLRTAVLDRFCAPLCASLLDVDLDADMDAARPDTEPTPPWMELADVTVASKSERPAISTLSAMRPSTLHAALAPALLEQAERADLFLVPLDDERCWYRYHHLFADVLRSRLRQANPHLYAALHRQASAWCEEEGLVEEAVAYALAAADFERAAILIERHGLALGFGGQIETVLGWLQALPASLTRTRPRLGLCHAVLLFMKGSSQAEDYEALLRAGEETIAAWHQQGAPEAELRPVRGMLSLVQALLAFMSGDVERSAEHAHAACEHISENDLLWYALARYYALSCQWLTGDVTGAAQRALVERITALCISGNLYAAREGSRMLADMHRLQGRLRAAAAAYEAPIQAGATAISAEAPVNEYVVGPSYCFGLGEIHLEWNHLEVAEPLLMQGMLSLGRGGGDPHWITKGYLALARLQHARGEEDAAGATLEALAALAEHRQFIPDLRLRCAALQAQLAVAQGNLAEAVRWAESCGLSLDDAELPYLRESAYLALVRVRLAQGRPDRPGSTKSSDASEPVLAKLLHLLDRLLAEAERTERRLSILEILLLRALVLQARRDTHGAVRTLAQVLALAQPEGYVRLFVDEGIPLAPLLTLVLEAAKQRRLAISEAVRDYAHRLVPLCRPQQGGDAEAPSTAPTQVSTQGDLGRAVWTADPLPPVVDVPPLVDPLTLREVEVLRLLAVGASNAAVAEALVVTVGTVKKHVFHLCRKLGVRSRTQAIARARTLHLL